MGFWKKKMCEWISYSICVIKRILCGMQSEVEMRKLHQKGSLLFFSPPYSQETYFIVCCCVKSLSSCQSLSGSLAENSSAFSPDRWAHRLSSAGGRCLWGGLCLSLAARREELEGRTHMMDHTAQSSHEGPGQSKPIRVSPTCSTDSAPT